MFVTRKFGLEIRWKRIEFVKVCTEAELPWFSITCPQGSQGVAIYLFIFKLTYLIISFLAVLGLLYWAGFSLVVESGGHSLLLVPGLLIAVASLIAQRRL